MIENAKHAAHELQEYLRDQAHWKTMAKWILIGSGVMALVVWFGRGVIDEINVVENWIGLQSRYSIVENCTNPVFVIASKSNWGDCYPTWD
jgi:hypothetical protein